MLSLILAFESMWMDMLTKRYIPGPDGVGYLSLVLPDV
jgi:hypothetical protein